MSRRPFRAIETWTDPRHQLGFHGEQAAIRYLNATGYIVLSHRFRVGHNDLDLVVRRGALVVFVEVKTRTGVAYGTGREAIGWRKRQALGRVAEVWRLRHGAPGDLYRFDVVEVVRVGGDTMVNHIEDAWRLER
jgi:putative endonuclease